MTKAPGHGNGGREARVGAQYEALPYPKRNPAEEKNRLITGSPSHLSEIEHYLRHGRRADGLAALVAGGGTGDGAIMLAQQLADRGAGGTVDYLDLSHAALKIARRRAKVRGLNNIRFRQGSLLDLGAIYGGPYDYIDCCGVLHHLEDPAAGLAALGAVLADDGGMGLMVYGEYGRTGVYHLQSALRRLAGPDAQIPEQLDLARRVLAELPAGNWLKRNPFVGDHLENLTGAGAEAGLYDLLLHARDRAYTVPQLGHWTAAAGLEISAFIEPKRYDPALYLQDPELLHRAARLPWLDQCALAEELSGAMKVHILYAVKSGSRAGPADPGDLDLVPVLRQTDGAALADGLRKSPRITVDLDGGSSTTRLATEQISILARIDGRASAAAIRRALAMDPATFEEHYGDLFAALQPLNLMLLRTAS